jgi:biotin transporter BioY
MTKKILLSGIVGTVVYYLLGWLVYGLILTDKSKGEESMLFIFLGCLFLRFY